MLRDAPLLSDIATFQDLTELARSAAASGPFPFDDAADYDSLFDNIARILHRSQAHHVLLVGERGVGKHTVIAELARRAVNCQPALGEGLLTSPITRPQVSIPPFLCDKRMITVDCRYVCPEDSRRMIVGILNQVGGRPELIVAVDGFASLLRSERGTSNKPLLFAGLSRVACHLIGLMTPHEHAELIADDPDYADFFGKVEVDEPAPETAVKLLRHYAHGLEQKFQVGIDEAAIHEAVSLSTAYILNDHLPAKALKVLHSLCEEIDYDRTTNLSPSPFRGGGQGEGFKAEGQGEPDPHRQGDGSPGDSPETPLSPPGERGRGEGAPHPTTRITADHVVRRVAHLSGVPEHTLRGIGDRIDYAAALGEHIFGQAHAVNEVATELGLIKAGMTDANKPASVIMFIGQTGTGKTEMAKVLARFYSTSKRLKVYTLGNCVEPHSVSTIIGVPPGYVGADRGGPLVNDLNADPYCVFLLDEVDKAHPDVLQPFLNLFDEGWVKDHRGARGHAGKAIFILTSNVGQRMLADMVEKKQSIEEITARMREVLSQIRHTKADRPVFTPEFLARLKRIIVFGPLDKDAMHQIARKLVRELCEHWQSKRNKRLEVPEELIQHIGEEAHKINEKSKGKEGGRIVRKLISEKIEARLQKEISQHPEEYKAAAAIAVKFQAPNNVDVQFIATD